MPFAFRARVSVRAGLPSSPVRAGGGGYHAGQRKNFDVSGGGPLVALKISSEKADYPNRHSKMIFFWKAAAGTPAALM